MTTATIILRSIGAIDGVYIETMKESGYTDINNKSIEIGVVEIAFLKFKFHQKYYLHYYHYDIFRGNYSTRSLPSVVPS